MRIKQKYMLVFLILLLTEIIIALYIKDAIIRPYVGDILVLVLMYTFIRGLVRKPIRFLPVYLFFFASIIELGQYYHIVEKLHVQNNKLISTILGTSFDIKDILCYLISTVLLIIWEKIEKNKIIK